jgi:hypothetical protein
MRDGWAIGFVEEGDIGIVIVRHQYALRLVLYLVVRRWGGFWLGCGMLWVLGIVCLLDGLFGLSDVETVVEIGAPI